MVVSFYLGINQGPTVDASSIECGNPGVGGTQYCMIELAHYLNTNTEFKVNIIAYRKYQVEDGITYSHIESEDEVCDIAIALKTDILVTRVPQNPKLRDILSSCNMKVVIWSHNFLSSKDCDYISQSKSIVANVFVGKQVYDCYIDDDVIKKSTFIYNMYYDRDLKIERRNDCSTVVYMGAIVPRKGFCELCSIWPEILEKVPDAKLKVLGSGNLYGDAKLGKYGIAVASYEKRFIKYITDGKGNIIPSVEFLGVVGNGKEHIFANASVGVVNPSAHTETFGMGVVEMAEVGLPVVTRGKNGYFDTINNRETGILSRSLSSMADDIVELLTDSTLNERLGLAAKRNNRRFLPDVIGQEWEKILADVCNDSLAIPYLGASKPYSNNIKWARMISRFLRFNLGLRFIPSFIKLESLILRILRG